MPFDLSRDKPGTAQDTRRDKGARAVLAATYLGPAATALLVVTLVLHIAGFIRGFAVGMLIASLAVLLLRGLRDEYLQRLWSAGASWAFVASVVWLTAAPLVLGTFEGSGETAWVPDVPAVWSLIVAMTAFFAGFHWARLRAEA